jgi:hypothetical protein
MPMSEQWRQNDGGVGDTTQSCGMYTPSFSMAATGCCTKPLYMNSDLRNNGRELKSIAACIFVMSKEKNGETA